MYDRKVSDAKYRNRPEVKKRISANARIYHIKHREKIRLRSKLWYDNNKERARANNTDYRIKCKSEHKCPRCGKPLHPEMDEGCISCLNCRLVHKNKLATRRF